MRSKSFSLGFLAAWIGIVAAPGARAEEPRLAVRALGPQVDRTVIEGVLAVPVDALRANELGFYNLLVAGEVRSGGEPYDRFRYRFDVAADDASGKPLSVAFERTLRPGRFELVLQVRDLQSGWSADLAQPLEVPRLAPPAPAAGAPPPLDTTVQPAVRIVAPATPVLTGLRRFDAEAGGPGVAAVRFVLDGRPMLTKRTPPWSVELDLGAGSRPARLRAEALGSDGRVVAFDEVVLNAGTGGSRLAVHLTAPADGAHVEGATVAAADLHLPPGGELARLELFVDDALVATRTSPPWQAPLPPMNGAQHLVRALATLADGTTAEDVRVVNGPPLQARLDVATVELYTAAVDRGDHYVHGLRASDFRVVENGVEQRIARFGSVDGLPIQVALVVDVSGSMKRRIDDVARAASDFVGRGLHDGDRAMLVTFNGAPRVAVDFTADRRLLANGLVALEADGGTALYDSLVFTLQQFRGRSGQRAIVLLSDGMEVDSRLGGDTVLELAQRVATTIYTVSLDLPQDDVAGRATLSRLSAQTGGRSFFVGSRQDLGAIYAAIERDLRSRYLLAYESSNTGPGFRRVEVAMRSRRLVAHTIQGYYP